MPEYNLLLVDDEPNILNALRRLLRREGYKLHMASSGDEALDVLAREHVDIVLADGRMPGISGTELLKKVKAQYPDTVRMVLTGYTDVGELVSAINEGEAYRFILKPWNDEELKLTIRHALEHHKLAKENEQLIATIKEQNEELKLLNTGLEAAVERKTRELQIHNRVLLLAQEVLDQLPIAVVGVDDTGTIVQANSRGLESTLLKNGAVGSNIKNCLPEDVQKTIRDTIESGTPEALEYAEALGEPNMFCYPLKRRGGVRGAVIISYPLDNPVFEHLHIMLSDDDNERIAK